MDQIWSDLGRNFINYVVHKWARQSLLSGMFPPFVTKLQLHCLQIVFLVVDDVPLVICLKSKVFWYIALYVFLVLKACVDLEPSHQRHCQSPCLLVKWCTYKKFQTDYLSNSTLVPGWPNSRFYQYLWKSCTHCTNLVQNNRYFRQL